ncbi:MAG TPA: cupin domain-containing protein [Mobilitalea sp.]|nr:cupin domain-containing protein [Mobilitalea sp.]
MEDIKKGKLKNINVAEILKLEDQVNYQEGQVVSKTLVQNSNISMTLFAFDKGEEISSHSSSGDAMVTVLDGVGKLTVGDDIFLASKGETLIMPADIPHAVYGEEQFKMLLTVIF